MGVVLHRHMRRARRGEPSRHSSRKPVMPTRKTDGAFVLRRTGLPFLDRPETRRVRGQQAEGLPSSRTVLAKGLDARGVVFTPTSPLARCTISTPPVLPRRRFPGSGSTGRCICAGPSRWSDEWRAAPTGRPGRAGHNWGRGPRPSLLWWRTGVPSTSPWSRSSGVSPTPSECRCRRTGVESEWLVQRLVP